MAGYTRNYVDEVAGAAMSNEGSAAVLEFDCLVEWITESKEAYEQIQQILATSEVHREIYEDSQTFIDSAAGALFVCAPSGRT